jgi:hypothetical protein
MRKRFKTNYFKVNNFKKKVDEKESIKRTRKAEDNSLNQGDSKDSSPKGTAYLVDKNNG